MPFDTTVRPYSRHTAIIDVGSNSFRLIVIEYVSEQWFHLVDEIRESVRLAEGMGIDGKLQPAAMERAIDTLHIYMAFCQSSAIKDIRACATAAVRQAKNQQEFIDRVLNEVGLEVEILSDYEEAYYGYLAVINSTLLENGFIADLGGASLEITAVRNREMQETISLPFGAVTVTEGFLGKTPFKKSAVTRLYQHVHKTLSALNWFRAEPGLSLIGQGGTIRNLARMTQKKNRYSLGELHGYTLPTTMIQYFCNRMVDKTLEQIENIPGMKEDRADIMLGGATVIRALLDVGDFDQMEICSQGLREGVFYERYLYYKANRRFDNVRRATIYNLHNLYPYQSTHAEHVAFLSLRLFDQAPADTMICNAGDRDLLWAAAILHDIGASIDYNDHHKHSAYLILNQGLPGFNHRELVMISNLARFHRKGTPNFAEHGQIMDETDALKLTQMTACLRLSEQLDRSRDGVVRDIHLHTEGEISYLDLEVAGDGVVALWSVIRHADIYEMAFGKKLIIRIRHAHHLPTHP